MAKPLDIQFSRPEEGWMLVTVAFHQSDVSDASCDSLNGLCKAMKSLSIGVKPEPVEWFIEPGYEQWCFDINGDQCRFVVLGVDQREILSVVIGIRELLLLLTDSLLSMIDSCQSYTRLDEHWSWDFPRDAIQRIQSSLE